MKWNPGVYDDTHSYVSKFGRGILAYLNPLPAETILDLGCGTGDLTKEISDSGARVIGVDESAEMIEKAQAKHPTIEFHRMDARQLDFDIRFDAIFSNAVLHWIPEKETVIEKMYLHLKNPGRLVLEFGGKGNNRMMLRTLREVFAERGHEENAKIDFWYYPSIGEYATELEKCSFAVTRAELFNRTTPLNGDHGIKDWFLMFGERFFAGISNAEMHTILDEVQERLRPTHFKNGIWSADYTRIRIVAEKIEDFYQEPLQM